MSLLLLLLLQVGTVRVEGAAWLLRPDGALPRATNTPLAAGETLRTGDTGRARLTLAGGSILSLGKDTEIMVDRHDSTSQRTALTLVKGSLRAQVVRLARSGASFEVRTTVGTTSLLMGGDFVIDCSEGTACEFLAARGATLVTADGTITLPAGEKIRIPR
jgi:hypothetical protein